MGDLLSTVQNTYKKHTNVHMLDVVRAPQGWGVFASDGPNYRHAIFGRDSIEVAEDILPYDRELARDIILTLARLQGTDFDKNTEEEPGKIHHEYRSTHFAGQAIPAESLAIMYKLQAKNWGRENKETMLYYGTFDATPLYIRLVGKFVGLYGDEILGVQYHDKNGREHAVLESVRTATDWLVSKLNLRDDRLLAYKRSNPQGIKNQVWKDSSTAYLFADGTLPNFEHPIVSTELQGYAYDALQFASQIFPARAGELSEISDKLRKSTIQMLWMPEKQFFAQGIGTHQSGEERLIDTLTSNGALLLDSSLLPINFHWSKSKYVIGIDRMVTSREFLTDAGIRCRSVRHAQLLPYVDYHGSYAVWAKETADIARGLESHGRTRSARKLRRAILQSFRTAGNCYELFYVDIDGTVYYNQDEASVQFSHYSIGEPTPIPEPGQAWSISAAIASAQLVPESQTRISYQKSFSKAQQHRALLLRLIPNTFRAFQDSLPKRQF